MTADKNHLHKISSSWGDIVVELRNEKVISCTLPHLTQEPDLPFSIADHRTHPVVQFICDTFLGRRTKCPPIGALNGSAFQKQVWAVLMKIPAGETRTYGEVAQAIGKARAYRAVANACGKNPAPLFIPCHRVIGSDGKLHGFSAGTPWKRLLLTLEDR